MVKIVDMFLGRAENRRYQVENKTALIQFKKKNPTKENYIKIYNLLKYSRETKSFQDSFVDSESEKINNELNSYGRLIPYSDKYSNKISKRETYKIRAAPMRPSKPKLQQHKPQAQLFQQRPYASKPPTSYTKSHR